MRSTWIEGSSSASAHPKEDQRALVNYVCARTLVFLATGVNDEIAVLVHRLVSQNSGVASFSVRSCIESFRWEGQASRVHGSSTAR